MKKILIIGKKSFLGSNLKIYLSKFFKVENYSYEQIIKKEKNFFLNYTHIINTTIHPKYVKSKYNKSYDLDKNFIKKFNKINFTYIFLNTRKIYFPRENISEKSKISPLDNYAKNKFITEKFLIKFLKKRLISLRISNVLGKRIYKNVRKNHKLFLDNFFDYKKKNKKFFINNDFKDFISIEQFCRIIHLIIKQDVRGIFNVSISKKIYLSQIIKWIDKQFLKKIEFQKTSKNSFTLSNNKLIKKIRIRITVNQLKSFCKNLI